MIFSPETKLRATERSKTLTLQKEKLLADVFITGLCDMSCSELKNNHEIQKKSCLYTQNLYNLLTLQYLYILRPFFVVELVSCA